MAVSLCAEPFDPWLTLAQHAASLRKGDYGACASFIGTMRDTNLGDAVRSLTLEHYPEMTQHYLESLTNQAVNRWQLNDSLIIHRYGQILPGDTIVLIAAWSAHRAEAFEACRYLIEELKARAPFWKKEITQNGERWLHDAPSS